VVSKEPSIINSNQNAVSSASSSTVPSFATNAAFDLERQGDCYQSHALRNFLLTLQLTENTNDLHRGQSALYLLSSVGSAIFR
jgi:hypothetical protein